VTEPDGDTLRRGRGISDWQEVVNVLACADSRLCAADTRGEIRPRPTEYNSISRGRHHPADALLCRLLRTVIGSKVCPVAIRRPSNDIGSRYPEVGHSLFLIGLFLGRPGNARELGKLALHSFQNFY
jgi:hypothetical protein